MAFKPKSQDKFDTAITVRVRRHQQTFFIVCDEYESVHALKGRVLGILQGIGFTIPKQEEELTVDDLRLCLKKRVSQNCSLTTEVRFLTLRLLVMISRFSTTHYSIY